MVAKLSINGTEYTVTSLRSIDWDDEETLIHLYVEDPRGTLCEWITDEDPELEDN